MSERTENGRTDADAPASAREAFVELASEETVRAAIQSGAKNPYDFGFTPNMTRLIMAHDEIAPKFRALTAQLLFRPGVLTRDEREMVAGVAAAAQDCFY